MSKPENTHLAALLFEYRQEGQRTWAYRIYQDGLIEEYTDSEMAFIDGEIVTRTIPLDWREMVRLSSAEVGALTVVLREVGFFDLPDQLGSPGLANDAPLFSWRVQLDGQQKTVAAVGEVVARHAALIRLREIFQQVTAQAFERTAAEAPPDEA